MLDIRPQKLICIMSSKLFINSLVNLQPNIISIIIYLYMIIYYFIANCTIGYVFYSVTINNIDIDMLIFLTAIFLMLIYYLSIIYIFFLISINISTTFITLFNYIFYQESDENSWKKIYKENLRKLKEKKFEILFYYILCLVINLLYLYYNNFIVIKPNLELLFISNTLTTAIIINLFSCFFSKRQFFSLNNLLLIIISIIFIIIARTLSFYLIPHIVYVFSSNRIYFASPFQGESALTLQGESALSVQGETSSTSVDLENPIVDIWGKQVVYPLDISSRDLFGIIRDPNNSKGKLVISHAGRHSDDFLKSHMIPAVRFTKSIQEYASDLNMDPVALEKHMYKYTEAMLSQKRGLHYCYETSLYGLYITEKKLAAFISGMDAVDRNILDKVFGILGHDMYWKVSDKPYLYVENVQKYLIMYRDSYKLLHDTYSDYPDKNINDLKSGDEWWEFKLQHSGTRPIKDSNIWKTKNDVGLNMDGKKFTNNIEYYKTMEVMEI